MILLIGTGVSILALVLERTDAAPPTVPERMPEGGGAVPLQPVGAREPALTASDSAQQAETHMTLRVVALNGGETVLGATARLEGTGSMDGDRRANGDGEVVFPVGIPGRGTITVSAHGYFTRRVPFAELLQSVDPEGICTIALRRAADLTVRVLDLNGRPVQDAYVTAYPYDARIDARKTWHGWWPSFRRPGWYVAPFSTTAEQRAGTDDRGEVTLLQLPREMELLVTAAGPLITTTGVITIGGDQARAELELRGDTGVVVTGRFVREDGSPASGLTVSFYVGEHLSEAKQVKVAQDGAIRLAGMREEPTSWQVNQPGSPVLIVDVVAPTTDLGTIIVPQLAELSGTIETGSACLGDGVVPIAVDVLRNGQPIVRLGTRKSGAGQMEFWGRVPQGLVQVRASSKSRVLDVAEVAVPSPNPVVLSAVDRLASIELVVPDAPVGTAIDALIVPLGVDGARDPRKGMMRASTVPGQMLLERVDDGLVLGCVPPGRYDVELDAGALGGGALFDLELTAGGREVRRVDLGKATVQCKVRTPAGEWLEGVEVGLSGGAHSSPDGTTDSSGSVVFSNVRPGRMLAFPTSAGPHSEFVTQVLAEPGKIQSVELVIERPIQVKGVVLRNAQPEQGAVVEAWPRIVRASLGEWRKSSAVTGSEGAFTLESLIPGEYELVARSNLEYGRSLVNHRFITVGPGVSSVLEIDLVVEEDEAFLIVDGAGDPIRGIRHGWATSRQGVGALQPDPQSPGRLLGGPRDGPWLLNLTTESSLGSAFPPGDGEGSLVILVPESAPRWDLGVVAPVGRGSLLVETSENAGVAHVQELLVRGLQGADGLLDNFDPISIQFRRLEGRLVAERLPDGLILELVGVGRDGEWPLLDLVSIEGATTTSWPPDSH